MAHPTLFTGPRNKLGVKITAVAHELVNEAQGELRILGHGKAATASAAVEWLIRKGSGLQVILPVVTAQPAAAPTQTVHDGDS